VNGYKISDDFPVNIDCVLFFDEGLQAWVEPVNIKTISGEEIHEMLDKMISLLNDV